MKKLSFIVLILFLYSCHNSGDVAKVWLFDKADFTEDNIDYSIDQNNRITLSPESFLNLERSGKYTSYFGKYEQGEWQLKGDVISLATPNKTMHFQIKKNEDGELQLYYKPRAALYTFEGYENTFTSELEDPFSYSNNKWREKASRSETDEEITNRLKNFFRFYEKYFGWAEKINAPTLKINNVPCPLTIYGNGFELIHYTQEPYEWQQHFYDTTDVKKAYIKIYYLFQQHDLDWNKDKGRYVMFQSAFHQMQNLIK